MTILHVWNSAGRGFLHACISSNNNKIFIYTDKKDRPVNYKDWLVSIGDQCLASTIYNNII